MTTVWKFQLEGKNRDLINYDDLSVSINARVISAAVDNDGRLTVWVEVDPGAVIQVLHRVFVIGTGRPVPLRARFVQTVVCNDGYVWHIYDGGSMGREP